MLIVAKLSYGDPLCNRQLHKLGLYHAQDVINWTQH